MANENISILSPVSSDLIIKKDNFNFFTNIYYNEDAGKYARDTFSSLGGLQLLKEFLENQKFFSEKNEINIINNIYENFFK